MKATLDAIDHSDYELDFFGGQVTSRGRSAAYSYSVLRGVSETGWRVRLTEPQLPTTPPVEYAQKRRSCDEHQPARGFRDAVDGPLTERDHVEIPVRPDL